MIDFHSILHTNIIFNGQYTKPNECPSWKLMSSHFLSVWHLNKLGILNQDTISESFTTFDEGYDENVDYHIFRDRGKLLGGINQQELVENQLNSINKK